MAEFSKRHHEIIADALRVETERAERLPATKQAVALQTLADLAYTLAEAFREDNSRFDTTSFYNESKIRGSRSLI